MDKTIYRLFSMLRHSLLGIQSDNSLFCSMTASEWNNLMNISQKQGVTAFALTALNDFVTKPEQALLMKWISLSLFIEKNYRRQEKAAEMLSKAFAKHGIRTLVLKGLAISQCYPIPYHRYCGDADIFLVKDDKSACEEGNRVHRHGAAHCRCA